MRNSKIEKYDKNEHRAKGETSEKPVSITKGKSLKEKSILIIMKANIYTIFILCQAVF